MKFSDFKSNHVLEIVNDCDFDAFYLIGKPKQDGVSAVTFMEDIKYIDAVLEANVVGVICGPEHVDTLYERKFKGGICTSDNPRIDFFNLYNLYHTSNKIQPVKTTIGTNCNIHDTAVISEYDVIIDDNVEIGPYVVIEAGTHICEGVTIEAGCKLGVSAFYHIYSGGERVTVKSTGCLMVDRNVYIHSNCVMEKGVLGGMTHIGKNVSVDSHALVSHDVNVDDNCRIAGGVILAGFVVIGANTQLGMSVNVAPNVKIGKNVQLSIGAVVTKDVPDSSRYSGNFAVDHEHFIKYIKSIAR